VNDRLHDARRFAIQFYCYDDFDKENFDMRGLSPDRLRTLLTVIEGRSFSAAARRLHLSQPAISLQIRELERRFGVQLVERLGKQAHATPAGLELAEAARGILAACDTAEAAMRRYRGGWIGRVRIGTTNTALKHLLPPVLRRLSADHAGLELHVTNLPTRESVEAILQNRLDLAIVTLPVDAARLRVVPLRLDPLMAILPKDWRDIPDAVTPDYAARQPLVLEHMRAALQEQVARWLAPAGPPERIPMHLGTIDALISAVGANLGMSFVPAIALDDHPRDIAVRPMRPALAPTIGLIEHRSKPNDKALEIVREALLGLRQPGFAARRLSAARP
jgi:DNA-binding transcriptional LysR family regulator